MSSTINNDIYDELGERWYKAFDDPVALLRAESKLMGPWIIKTAQQKMVNPPIDAIDLGCGGGFIANQLALAGLKTIGLDLSESSLAIGRQYDGTKSVIYQVQDITNVKLGDKSADLITCCDVIEHVLYPEKIIKEAYRLLRPGGIFFFHTFNRNLIAYFVVIKLVEYLVKNTPKNLHVLSMFVKPQEVKKWIFDAGFSYCETIGIRPSIRSLLKPSIFKRIVPESLQFKFTNLELISYAGFAIKGSLKTPNF